MDMITTNVQVEHDNVSPDVKERFKQKIYRNIERQPKRKNRNRDDIYREKPPPFEPYTKEEESLISSLDSIDLGDFMVSHKMLLEKKARKWYYQIKQFKYGVTLEDVLSDVNAVFNCCILGGEINDRQIGAFDPNIQDFNSHFSNQTRRFMLELINDRIRMFSMPKSDKRFLARIKQIGGKLEQQLGRPPSDDELLEHADIKLIMEPKPGHKQKNSSNVLALYHYDFYYDSLHVPVDPNEETSLWRIDEITYEEVCSPTPRKSPDPTKRVEEEDLVRYIVKGLSKVEIDILERFHDGATGKEIANELKLTEPKVSRLKNKAISFIRNKIRNDEELQFVLTDMGYDLDNLI